MLLDPPLVGASANAVAPEEASALRQVDPALRRAFGAADLEVGAIRRVELVRYDVLREELGDSCPPDDGADS